MARNHAAAAEQQDLPPSDTNGHAGPTGAPKREPGREALQRKPEGFKELTFSVIT